MENMFYHISLGSLCIWCQKLFDPSHWRLHNQNCSPLLSFRILSFDIKAVSFLRKECFWTKPFTSGSVAEIWPCLVVTENHYQLTATWCNELVSLIPVPNGHISVNTVTTGTNWCSQPKDLRLNWGRKLNLPLHPLPGFWNIMDRHFIPAVFHRLFLL